MTNLISEKLNSVYKLLAEHKFDMISTVDDDLKCVICKNILVNACQAICECNFCYKCIHDYMNNGGVLCPGFKEECKLETLSNLATNHKANKLISKLIVNCCEKSCSYQCQLIDMEEHVIICLNDSQRNSWKNTEIANEKFTKLIDLMKNFRAEIIDLKTMIGRNNQEIKHLKESGQKKDERIDYLNKKIILMKKDYEDLIQQVEIGNRNLWHKIDEINIELKKKCQNDVCKSLIDDIELLKKNGNSETKQLSDCKILIEEWKEKIQTFNKENDKCVVELITKINEFQNFFNMRDEGILKWQLGKIYEIEGRMASGYFYNRLKPYRMELQLKNTDDELIIWLSIHGGACDTDLNWPCLASITITIFSMNTKHAELTLSELCAFEKPSLIDSYEASELFTFSHSDLQSMDLLNTNCIVKCDVKFE